MQLGIKPVYVFDGKAPKLKCGELSKRAERRKEAHDKLDEAKEVQNVENIQRFNKRLVRVTRKHNEDCKKLLTLLGVPVVQAPSEAEAQCAQLCKEGLVYAAATEDMDALTFGCPRLVRNFTSANNEKVKEFVVEKVLNGLNLTQDQFIDLSILMGCDYCDNIKGIGGKKGLELIRKYGSIEKILEHKFNITEFVEVEIEYDKRIKEVENADKTEADQAVVDPVKDEDIDTTEQVESEKDASLNDSKDEETEIEKDASLNDSKDEEVDDDQSDKDSENEEPTKEEQLNDGDGKSNKKNKPKQTVSPNWPFLGARKLFQEPYVLKEEIKESDLKQADVNEDALVNFLCNENGFSEDRVRNAVKRIRESKSKSSQTRIDSFFKIKPQAKPADVKSTEKGTKRKDTAKNASKSKRGRK